MGLYIKGLEAPQFSHKDIEIWTNGKKLYALEKLSDGTKRKLEVIELKTPHGNLLDNDFVIMHGDTERQTLGDTFDSGVDFVLDFMDTLPIAIERED